MKANWLFLLMYVCLLRGVGLMFDHVCLSYQRSSVAEKIVKPIVADRNSHIGGAIKRKPSEAPWLAIGNRTVGPAHPMRRTNSALGYFYSSPIPVLYLDFLTNLVHNGHLWWGFDFASACLLGRCLESIIPPLLVILWDGSLPCIHLRILC